MACWCLLKIPQLSRVGSGSEGMWKPTKGWGRERRVEIDQQNSDYARDCGV